MTLAPLEESTRSAHWGWDEHRYFGHRVFADLTGSESLTGMMALSITGRRLPADQVGLLDDAAGALTLADPRIWPLKLTRVIAAYGSVIPALCAGTLLEDGARIGPWAVLEGAKVLIDLEGALGGSLEQGHVRSVVEAYLREHRFVWGFGTPFRQKDERLVAFRTCVERRGKHVLPHWKTMEAVAAIVRELRHDEPNIGIALAAVMLDMGLSPKQIGALVVALMEHMFFAHAVEGSERSYGSLRELPAEYVTYRGRAPRSSPRARAREAESYDAVRPAVGAE
jgi:hypothetical protein